MTEKITIVGGYGGMGKFFAGIFAEEGFDVTITGPNEAKGKAAAEELGVSYERDNKKATRNAEIVIISVPVNSTLEVIREVAPEVKEGSLLMDVTSIKEEPCKTMEEHSKKGVEIIGTHPMFSHRVAGMEGQVFIITPIRGGRWLTWLKKFLKKHKSKVYESTPEEHDETMAVVQGLTHFTYISIGKTLQEIDFDLKKSRNFSSPIYELMLDMVGRIIGQNPELYAAIQMQNPRTTKVHERFLEVAERLSKAVKDKDEKNFQEMMLTAARHFDDVDQAMGRSDKAISSLVSELSHLEESIGKELCLRHIYSGQTHLGIVKSVTPEKVVLEDSGKEFNLKISNIQILGEEERIGYKKNRYGTIERDFSVILDKGVNEETVSTLLGNFDENILLVKIKDVYTGPQIEENKKSVCFGVEMMNYDVKEMEERINRFLTDLGGKPR
ncbi:MAG: prephenate dehydrogenase [Candidatus Altiarchaeota archaeon]|nr:prephenate dehydrogenase [Candidatus Altiarchaeota archaeon]